MEGALAYAAESLGVQCLNECQTRAVKATISGKDVFACLPTGYGKSLCFLAVPFALDYLAGRGSSRTALIVEPTAAIMTMQVQQLAAKDISAAYINHEQDDPVVKKGVLDGKYKFVFISPESLSMHKYRDMLLSSPFKENLCLFVVDEAHCILSWRDFRHQFQLLGEVRSLVSTATVMALTATCTSVNITAIKQELSMDNCETILRSPDRSNLFLSTTALPPKKEDWFEFLEPDVATLTTLGITAPRKFFFCRTIEVTCQLFEFYREKLGDKCLAVADNDDEPSNRIISMYHSQSPPSVKKAVSSSLSDPSGVIRRVFATQSLSMGIDCPNVREVIHFGPPKSLECYLQEIGRAGRDKLMSKATILFCSQQLQERFTTKPVIQLCRSTTNQCLRKIVMDYFSADCCTVDPVNCCLVCALNNQ